MKLIVKRQALFTRLTVYFATLIRFVLNVLLIITIVALLIGVFKAGADLYHNINQPLNTLLQKVLLDAVFILALVEITIVILGYLKDGRVHVRYIVDTILIIMLNEVVRLWFEHHPTLQQAISISVLLATLAAVRITTVRIAPNHTD